VFCKILDDMGIDYYFQYAVDGYLYDFRIKNQNILIEVDGDWYHCNPERGIIPEYAIQKHTVEHDLVKDKAAKDNGYTLLRFWENDINNNRKNVIKELIKNIYF